MEHATTLKKFKCPRCSAPQALTDGTDIYFGAKKVPGNPTKIAWLCKECRAEVKWRKAQGIENQLTLSTK